MNQENKKEIFSKLSLFFIGFILAAILLFKCEGEHSKDNTDVLNSKYDSLSKEIAKKDIIADSLNKQIDKLDTVREKILHVYHVQKKTINVHDTVLMYKFVQICDSVIEVDSIEINTLKTLNNNLIAINKDKSDMLYNRNQVIDRKDAIIDSLTKSKKKYWKGFKHGFVAGAILVESLNIGAKALVK